MLELEYFIDHWWITALILGLGIPIVGFLHQAACALSDIESPYLKSLIQGVPTFAASVAVCWVLAGVFGQYADSETEAKFTMHHLLGIGVGLLGSWALGTIVYAAFLKGRVGKGAQISLIELFMRGLILVLVGGVLAVVFACINVYMKSEEGANSLMIFGGVVLGILVLVGGLFLMTNILRNQMSSR